MSVYEYIERLLQVKSLGKSEDGMPDGVLVETEVDCTCLSQYGGVMVSEKARYAML